MTNPIYSEIKSLLEIPETLKKIQKQQQEIEKKLDKLMKMASSDKKGDKKFFLKKGTDKPSRKDSKRSSRTPSTHRSSNQDLIASVLKGKRKPLSINEIHDIIIQNNLYKGKAKDLKRIISVTLYQNKKGVFRRVGPGKFKLT